MKICPFCGVEFDKEDLRNAISIKESNISGLCQKCQDDIFGED